MKAHQKNSILVNFFNLALRVESLLDNIRDPAERQLAVECLVVISRIEDRNPEIGLTGAPIDILLLIKNAVNLFWTEWVADQSHIRRAPKSPQQDTVTQRAINSVVTTPLGTMPPEIPIVKPNPIGLSAVHQHSKQLSDNQDADDNSMDLSFAKNEPLARRLFFDLRQDGPGGTMSYLAASCIRLIFGVAWNLDSQAKIIGQ